MKQFLKKSISLCLAVVMLMSLTAGTGWAETAGEFVVTGYTASRTQITKGMEVNISLHLKHTEQKTAEGAAADISRLVDSFSGGTIHYAVTSAVGEPLELDVSVSKLKYSGTGKSLKLMISAGGAYEQLEVIVKECVEYEEPVYEPYVPEDPDPIPAPMAIMSRNEMDTPIKAGETRVITIFVKNVGKAIMKSPLISFSASDGLILPGTSNTLQVKDIHPGKTESVEIAVQALSQIASVNQSLHMDLKFQYYNLLSTVDGSSSGSVTIPAKVTKEEPEQEPDEDTVDSPIPNLIITSFSYGGESVAAGTDFNLNFQFVNTSSQLTVENVVVTLEGGEGFTINGATNTFYFEKVKEGGSKSVSVPMKALPDVKNGAQPVSVSFKYEYVDHQKRTTASSDVKMTVPVYQPDRFELSHPTLPVMVYAGEEISVTMNYVNKGKSAVSNVEARLEGNVETYTPVQNLGNMEAGKSGTIAFAVTAWEAPEADFTIYVTYEDANGEEKTQEFPVTLTVEEMVYEDPGMYEPMPEPEPEPQTNWKLIAALVAAAVLVGFVMLRKKKKAAALKKETELWNSWDETEDFAGEPAAEAEQEAKQ